MEKVGRDARLAVVTVYPDVGNLSAWGNDVPAERNWALTVLPQSI